MSDPISHCLERLSLQEDVKVKQRAQQFQGQLSSLPNKIFDKGPNLKSVICIQLAYESLRKYDWDIKLAGQLAGCTASAYDTCLSKVRQHLNIQPDVSFDTLTVALGSTTMLTPLNELWEHFVKIYIEKLNGARKVNAQKDLEAPCWKGAAVYCCAKAFGDNLSKDKIHSLCGCSLAELNKSVKVIQNICQDKIAGFKNQSTKITRPSRRAAASSTETSEKAETTKATKTTRTTKATRASDPEEGVTEKKTKRKRTSTQEEAGIKEIKRAKPISGIVSMINQQDYKKTKKYLDFIQWQTNLIQQLKPLT